MAKKPARKPRKRRPRVDIDGPNPVDVHVGQRVRMRRTLLGMSQEKLGKAVDLTFQQIQKYERGANRIGASRLYQFSQILGVPISYFFEDLDPKIAKKPKGLAESAPQPFENDQLARRETLELVRAYYRIGETPVRKRVFELVKALAGPIKGEKRGRPRKKKSKSK